MRRRALLGSIGLAALAGCSTGNESTTSTGTPTGTGDPEFELIGVEHPSSRALNVPTQFVIGVRNVGSGKGTFTTPLELKVGDGDWKKAGTVEMTLSAGETGEWRSPRFTPRYLNTLSYRLPEFDKTWSIEITPKRLDFNNYYAPPNGLYLNVLGGSFESEYPTADNSTATNTTSTPTSPDGSQIWAVIRLEVRNRLQEAQSAPDPPSFALIVDGEGRPQHQEVSDDPYEGGELAARTVTRGDLVYAVPEGTQAKDIEVAWSASLPNGDVKAIWTK